MRRWGLALCLAFGCSKTVELSFHQDASIDAGAPPEAALEDAVDRRAPPDADVLGLDADVLGLDADALGLDADALGLDADALGLDADALGLDADVADAGDATCRDVSTTYLWAASLRFAPGDMVANCMPRRPRVQDCVARVRLGSSADLARWCVGAHRSPLPDDRDECVVAAAATLPDGTPVAGETGYYFGPTSSPACPFRLQIAGPRPVSEDQIMLQCLAKVPDPDAAPACDPRPVGASCAVTPPAACEFGAAGCAAGAVVVFRVNTPECASGLCARYALPDAAVPIASPGACTCRCGVPLDLFGADAGPLCACPAGFVCVAGEGAFGLGSLRGSYCIRAP